MEDSVIFPNMVSLIVLFLSIYTIVEFQLVCCYSGSTTSSDLKIEVASHITADSQLSGKLYVDDKTMTVRCRVTNNQGDPSGFLDHHIFGKTLTSIGHAPVLVLYNDTWKETFSFPLGSWDNSEGYWEMTIPRKDLCVTDEVHKQILAEISVGRGLEKLSFQTVIIDLHSDPLWNQQFGTYLGPSLEDIRKDVTSVNKQDVVQHPCAPDTVLLLLQLDTDIVVGISHDMFIPVYTSWYNVTDLICKQHSNAVCKDLTMVDIKVTTEFVLLLTTKELFVGELLSVESRKQNKQFHWVLATLPNELHSSDYMDLELEYTSICTSPTHAGDVQGVTEESQEKQQPNGLSAAIK
ncbi:cation channel sperm-associated auxiliary subunit beta-like [Amphiura filiformis]|uniref:cation channel sperm-associated auxiliary subunit beta-like n=1 Tax=Amphiura filiformis TaxID=82378 RepID=UPI003B20D6D6